MTSERVTPANAAGVGWSTVASEVETMRDRKKPEPEIAARIGALIMSLEREWGSFVFKAEGSPRIFDGVGRKVLVVSSRSDAYQDWLASRYGLLWSDIFTRHVSNFLRAWVSMYGDEKQVRRFSYFDLTEKVLYLSRFDGSVYRLDGEQVEIIPNGQGVLFVDDGAGIPCDADIGPHGELVPSLIADLNFARDTLGGITPEAQADLFAVWLHALGFADLFPTKPVLLVEGTKGSGKSLALKRLQLVLTGKARAIILSQKGGEDDFAIQLLHSSPLALFDNVDTAIDWLRDAVAAYATSGSWVRRQKYTDAGLTEIRPSAFVAASSRNAVTFRRDDIADRCLVIRLERRSEFVAEQAMLEGLAAARPRLLGEWIWNLNACVARLRSKVPLSAVQASRMADFGRFAAVAGPTLGASLQRVEDALAQAQRERDALVLEDDPLLELLLRWIDLGNTGRPVTAQMLLTDLIPLMTALGLEPYPSARVLASRLREKADAMADHVRIERQLDRRRTTMYVITRISTGSD